MKLTSIVRRMAKSLAARRWSLLEKIETEVFQDLGNRGIANLLVKDDFHKACLSLSQSSSCAIILGFPIFEDEPTEENDGVAGAIYIAKALLHLQKSVTFFIDSHSTILKKTLEECAGVHGYLKGAIEVKNVGKDFSIENLNVLVDPVTEKARYSHLISIERPCQNSNGQYMTMKGRDISKDCDPIDVLFLQAQNHSDITTVCIGDGGNEVGMGKVFEQVVRYVANGEQIAASISCDYLLTCGVSNWGGIAIAAGMFVVQSAPKEEIDDFVLSDEKDEELHRLLLMLGFRDGINRKAGMTIDGLDYYKFHLPVLQNCRLIATQISK